MSVNRWILKDTSNDESTRVPLNPNKMTTPTFQRSMEFAWGTKANESSPSGGISRIRAIDNGQQQPTEWSFEGVILKESHYNLLLAWTKRLQLLHITDHLDRTFEVIIQRFDPIERQRTPNNSWKMDYTMSCMLLRRVS
jgi:hypothetical protein